MRTISYKISKLWFIGQELCFNFIIFSLLLLGCQWEIPKPIEPKNCDNPSSVKITDLGLNIFRVDLVGNVTNTKEVTWQISSNGILVRSDINKTSPFNYNVSNLAEGENYEISAIVKNYCEQSIVLKNSLKLCTKAISIQVSNVGSTYNYKLTGDITDVSKVQWKVANNTGTQLSQQTLSNPDNYSYIHTQSGSYSIIAEITTLCNTTYTLSNSYFASVENVTFEKIWDKSFGGNGNDGLENMLNTNDGGFLLTGWTDSQISGNKTPAYLGGLNDFWVVKVNSNWDIQWQKSFGGNGNDLLLTSSNTTDGGALLGGWSDSSVSGNKTTNNNGDKDIWVVKIDGNGNKVWDSNFGGTGIDYLKSITTTTDGGALLLGYTSSNISGNKNTSSYGNGDLWVIKINSQGAKVWEKTYGGNGYDEPGMVKTFTDGSILVTGLSQSFASGNKTSGNNGSYDGWVLKLNSTGDKVWERNYGGVGNETVRSTSILNDGSILIGGVTGTTTSGQISLDSDIWLVKLNTNGNIIWESRLGGTGNESLQAFIVNNENNIFVSGYSTSNISRDKSSNSFGDYDYWVLKVDQNGKKKYDITVGGSSYDDPATIVLNSLGEIFIGGKSDSGITGNKTAPNYGQKDFWIVKLR